VQDKDELMSKARRYLSKDIGVTKRKVVVGKNGSAVRKIIKNNAKNQEQRKAEIQKGKTLLNKGDQ